MDRSAPIPIRAGTTARRTSAMQEQTGRTDGSVAETPPPGLTQGGSQAGPFARSGKDVVEEIGLARRDTTDSCLSDFSQRRSNTGWSIAASTATDLTDLNSPADVAFPEDGLELDSENCASSPRRGSLFPRPTPFHKRLPFRTPSISGDADRSRMSLYGSSPDSLAPRHRRLEQMAPRKPSLNRYPGPTSPSAGPGSPGRREPSPSGSDPWIRETASRSPRDSVEEAASDGDGDEPDRSMVGGSRESELQPPKDELEERPMREDGTDADASSDDDAPTPGRNFTDESLTDEGEGLESGETFDGRRGSSSDEGPGPWDEDEDEGPATFTPDDSIIYDVCEQVLQQAFGVQLHEVALAGAMPAAYESVSYFVDELSHIILNSGLSHSGIVINESARAGPGSNNVPIWAAAGNAAGGVGGGSGRGDGHGRKRSNGGQDGADSGDGAGGGSPGGGKRQKVSPTEYLSTDMHFACPFRKRNPLRFNVRDSKGCATQSFPDISLVKRHIKNFHKPKTVMPFTCQRCGRAMRSQKALDEHVRVGRDQICSPQKVPLASSADPEDGITSGIEEVLNGRKAGRKIDTWESLWRLLFPDDDGIPEADFIPPTELDEVWAEFNADHSTRQLRQRIQQGLGPGSNVESLFDVFRSHIESVFDACQLKTSGTMASCRRSDAQTAQQATSRRNSVRFNPRRPISRGQGLVDSGVSSPVATPSSTAVLGGLDQSPMVEAQPRTPSAAPPLRGYPGAPRAEAVGGLMMPLVSSSSPNGGQGSQPVTVPPPAHVHMGFGSQAPNTTDALAGQAGHHSQRLLPMNPGMNMTAGFPDQGAANFSNLPLFGSQGYQALNFGHPMHDLCLRPPSQAVQGVQGPQELFSPTDPSMMPAITVYGAMDDGLEAVRRNSMWSDAFVDMDLPR